MAEFVNPIGKIRGKFGNVVAYVRPNGKNYCKGMELSRKPARETQKRQSVAFGTVVREGRWLRSVICLGFPGGNGYPKGANGFSSANVSTAVSTEQINPDVPVRQRRKAAREFRGVIDYGKLRVAAGALVAPDLSIEVDEDARTVAFNHQGFPVNAVDCLLDDKIYGVLYYVPNHRCRVVELGARGETFDVKVDFPEDAGAAGLVVYVFATTVDGKDVSDSVCLRMP